MPPSDRNGRPDQKVESRIIKPVPHSPPINAGQRIHSAINHSPLAWRKFHGGSGWVKIKADVLLPDGGGGLVVESIPDALLIPDVYTFDAGLDTPIGKKGVKLSGGQLHKAAAAHMLIREPELLVFDDLTSTLEVKTEQQLWRNLRGRTCLAVATGSVALQQADHIILMEQGRVSAIGTLSALKESLFQSV